MEHAWALTCSFLTILWIFMCVCGCGARVAITVHLPPTTYPPASDELPLGIASKRREGRWRGQIATQPALLPRPAVRVPDVRTSWSASDWGKPAVPQRSGGEDDAVGARQACADRAEGEGRLVKQEHDRREDEEGAEEKRPRGRYVSL